MTFTKKQRLSKKLEYIKTCFINASEDLFCDFKNKTETMKDKTSKMSNITNQQPHDVINWFHCSNITVSTIWLTDGSWRRIFLNYYHIMVKYVESILLTLSSHALKRINSTRVGKGLVFIMKEKSATTNYFARILFFEKSCVLRHFQKKSVKLRI